MAMTITPANDFPINQHNQVKTGPGLENSAALVKTQHNSGQQPSNKKATDSVELSSTVENLAYTGSRLTDFDQAQETTATLKNNVHMQSGRALQGQANISPETAFALLSE